MSSAAKLIRYSDLGPAYDFVSWSSAGENQAFIRRSTGEIFYVSELADENELPEDFEDHPDDFVEIPSKFQLDLGQNLVWRFLDARAPRLRSQVETFFRRRGAYTRFKDLLERHDLLKAWYDFEQEAVETELRQWCEENDVELAPE